jgi:hypothetical protein
MPSRFIAPAMRCENITLNSGWTQAGELLRGTQAQITKNGVTDAEAIYRLAEAYSARGGKSSALRVLRRSVEDGFFCCPYFTRDPLLDPLRCEPEFPERLHCPSPSRRVSAQIRLNSSLA